MIDKVHEESFTNRSFSFQYFFFLHCRKCCKSSFYGLLNFKWHLLENSLFSRGKYTGVIKTFFQNSDCKSLRTDPKLTRGWKSKRKSRCEWCNRGDFEEYDFYIFNISCLLSVTCIKDNNKSDQISISMKGDDTKNGFGNLFLRPPGVKSELFAGY